MPKWERDYLNDLAVYYDGVGSSVNLDLTVGESGYFNASRNNQFVQRFIACSKNEMVEYPHGKVGDPMNVILLAHACNPVGREMMYRIMAKLEPRIKCVNSIKDIIIAMSNAVDNNILDAVNICANFLVNFELVHNDSVNCLINDLENLIKGRIDPSAKFSKLYKNPVTFILNSSFQAMDGTSITIKDQTSAFTTMNSIIGILNAHEQALHARIDALRFRLISDPTGQDQYELTENKITITGQPCNCNLVTGPILVNLFEPIYIETQWHSLRPSSTLKHELGHYLRIGLEGFVSDTAFLSVGPALFTTGWLSSEYITHLADIWDDAEELTEIFGILWDGRNVLYDKLNQSNFNLAESHEDSVRYAHRDSRFPFVPYKFLKGVFEKNGIMPISNQSKIYYDRPIANI